MGIRSGTTTPVTPTPPQGLIDRFLCERNEPQGNPGTKASQRHLTHLGRRSEPVEGGGFDLSQRPAQGAPGIRPPGEDPRPQEGAVRIPICRRRAPTENF
jgi:hypothetical protein